MLRVLSVVFALSALVWPGYGAIDLAVSWDRDRLVVLEAAWGLFFTLLVAVPLLVIGFVPRRTKVARFELVLAVVLLTVTALVTAQWWLLLFSAGITLEAYVLLRVRRPLHRQEADPVPPAGAPGSCLPLAVALLGLGPWVGYGVANLARAYDDDAVRAVTMGVDHYAVAGALALAVPVLALLAAARPVSHSWHGWVAGLVACYLGVQSLVWPDEPGGLNRPAAALALCWGVAIWVIVLPRDTVEPRRHEEEMALAR